MNKLVATLASAAFGLGLLAGSALAGSVAPSQQDGPFQGVTIVPASASPDQATGEVAGFKRGKLVAFETAASPGDLLINTKQTRLS